MTLYLKMVLNNLTKDIEDYIRKDKAIKKIEKIQKNLKIPVKFKERMKRVKELLKIRDDGRNILQKISNENKVYKNIIDKIKKMIEKSDHLKRENCLLQVSGVVDVLKPNELCIFKEKSKNNMMEIRKYFGLHKNLYYDDGLSVSMAVTLPKLIQNYHSHLEMYEYTTVLTGTIYAKWKGNKGIESISAKQGDTLFIKPYTIHTILNKSNKIGLNATVKIPIGFKDRKNFDSIPANANGVVKLLKCRTIKKNRCEVKSFRRKENGYSYQIDFINVNPLQSIESYTKNDTCIYVINGNVEIEFEGKIKIARKDYVIFINKRTRYKINSLSKDKVINLYSVREL